MAARTAVRQWPKISYSATQLGGGTTAQGQSYAGGLDLITPSLRLPPGTLIDAMNFECAASGGYARIAGYERIDGHAAPSAATYTIVQVDQIINFPATGDLVTQATSGATGILVAGGNTSANELYLILTRVSGTFDQTHAVTMPGPLPIGTAVTLTVVLTFQLKAIYKAGAADYYRTLIGAVPGSGKILGVLAMNFAGVDNLYAFRANVGATAVAIYKTSASGWTAVPFYNLISFTAGSSIPTLPTDAPYTIPAGANITVGSPLIVENAGGVTVQGSLTVVDSTDVIPPQDGDTLVQGAVTATIKRVMWQSGLWSGTAAGQFVITNPTGGNFAAGVATSVGTASSATINLTGIQTAITLAIGGRFEFVKTNFSGDINTRRAYGCDGINQAFEFDGDTLAPISTGLSPDVPSHITAHKNYLIVSKGSSILGSGPGLPFKWTTTDGAWEIATGDTVNAMQTLPGDQTVATLAVLLKSNTGVLYGTDPTTFNFVTFNTGVGALPYTVQNLFDVFMLDTLGVVTLKTSLNFGNFASTALTRNILPFIQQERSKTTASITSHEKGQYRLFFSDGFALYATIVNQQYLGAIPQQFPNPVNVTDDTNLIDGSEAIYFGSTDSGGYIYQLDKGTSFDGADINAYFTTAWDPLRSPRIIKRFWAASIEVQGEGYAAIQYSYQLAYGNSQTAQPFAVPATLNLSRREYWDAFTWDEFVWDGANLMPSDVEANGEGENIQITITSGTSYISPYTIDSVIHHYTPRRGMHV